MHRLELTLKNIKIVVQYEGTRYRGWQRQATTELTIQGKLEGVLSKMTNKQVEIHGAGRTDAGAHAFAQVANGNVDTELSADAIKGYLNEYLPQDIRVTRCEEVDERFHSRLNAKGKTYVYRVLKKGRYDVFSRDFASEMEDSLNIEAMRKASKILLGEHDFYSFCTKASKKKTTNRRVDSIVIDETETEIRFAVTGNGFLYNMVRIIVGTLLEVGSGKRKPDTLEKALKAQDRKLAGETAPAKGLTLWNVEY